MKEQIAELWPAPPIQTDDLPIEYGLSSKRKRQSLAKIRERVKGVSVARD